MNKLTLAQRLADRVGIKIGFAEELITVIFGGRNTTGLLSDTLLAGDRVVIVGFGSFHRRQRRAKAVGGGATLDAPKPTAAKRVVRFRPARTLADRMA